MITIHGAGEYVGELRSTAAARASVMTLEPTTCAVVSGASLRDFIAAHPDFASHLIRKLIRRARASDREREEPGPGGRLRPRHPPAGELADPGEGGVRRVRERLTQQDIADRVGASREMVSRIFKDLTTGGYIASTRAGSFC